MQPTAGTSTLPQRERGVPRHNTPGSPVLDRGQRRPQFVNECGDWLRHGLSKTAIDSFQRLQPLLFRNRIRASAHTGLVGVARPGWFGTGGGPGIVVNGDAGDVMACNGRVGVGCFDRDPSSLLSLPGSSVVLHHRSIHNIPTRRRMLGRSPLGHRSELTMVRERDDVLPKAAA